jgi:hypothetical protein
LLALLMPNTAMALDAPATPFDQTIPPVWDIVTDDFESGSLVAIYQTGVAHTQEGYLTFWFNPDSALSPEPTPNYWPPGRSP